MSVNHFLLCSLLQHGFNMFKPTIGLYSKSPTKQRCSPIGLRLQQQLLLVTLSLSFAAKGHLKSLMESFLSSPPVFVFLCSVLDTPSFGSLLKSETNNFLDPPKGAFWRFFNIQKTTNKHPLEGAGSWFYPFHHFPDAAGIPSQPFLASRETKHLRVACLGFAKKRHKSRNPVDKNTTRVPQIPNNQKTPQKLHEKLSLQSGSKAPP